MESSFGTRLRLHRERQQVALSTIAEQTKIKASLLDGLERDDLSRWPGGIFRRSYVRAYADAIGLEPDSIVREFLELYPDPEDDGPVIAAMARAVDNDPNRRPPTRLGNLISSAIGALPNLRPPQRPAPAYRSDSPFEQERLGYNATAVDPQAWDDAGTITSQPASDEESDPAADVSLRPTASEAVAEAMTAAGENVPLSNGTTLDAPAVAAAPEVDRSADLTRLAALCTRLGRATDAAEIAPVLADTVRMFDAVGVMLWTWNSATGQLVPSLVHGYPEGLVAQLPGVAPEDDNAIAWAFRSEETRTIGGSGLATGALAVPLMGPAGCTGVLALELRHGHEGHETMRAVAEILAAQLSALIGHPPASGSQAAVNT